MRFTFTAIALACFAATSMGAGWPLLAVGAANLVVSFLWANDGDEDLDADEA